MVSYAEDADFRPRKRRNPAQVAAWKAERAAKRSVAEWRTYARDIVYRQLAARDRSTFELRKAMERNLVPQEIIEDTIAAFKKADLVDDARFAQIFVRSRFASKPTSRRALQRDLAAKGITGVLAEEALAQLSEEDELERAIEFAKRKAQSMRGLDREVRRRRLYGALGRRGYSSGVIRAAMDAADL